MSSWNIQIHNWIKYYIMLRWIDKSKPRHVMQPFPIFVSFFMSLVWHGIWSGYAITFLGTAVLDIIWKNLQKKALVEMIYENVPRPIYLALWLPVFRFLISFLTLTFHYQFFDRYEHLFSAFSYSPFAIYALCLLAMFILPNKRTPRPDK